jgi:hypothetical protein
MGKNTAIKAAMRKLLPLLLLLTGPWPGPVAST